MTPERLEIAMIFDRTGASTPGFCRVCALRTASMCWLAPVGSWTPILTRAALVPCPPAEVIVR